MKGYYNGDISSQASPAASYGEKLLIARGLVTGHKVVHKFGRNSDIDTADVPEDVWEGGGLMAWPTAAAVVSVTSTSVNDDGDPTTNTGAHTLTIDGLDSNFDELVETITLNGTSAVTTSGSFIRVSRAFVATCGTYHGSNEGAIAGTISGSTMFNILATTGQTELGRYTVPNGKTAYLQAVSISVASTKSATVEMFRCPAADDVTQPYGGAKRLLLRIDEVVGEEVISYTTPLKLDAKTDVWLEVPVVSANNTAVEVEFELTVIDD